MTIDPAHNIGDLVQLKTDPAHKTRIVKSITITGSLGLMYGTTHDTSESLHYAIELEPATDDASKRIGFLTESSPTIDPSAPDPS